MAFKVSLFMLLFLVYYKIQKKKNYLYWYNVYQNIVACKLNKILTWNWYYISVKLFSPKLKTVYYCFKKGWIFRGVGIFVYTTSELSHIL